MCFIRSILQDIAVDAGEGEGFGEQFAQIGAAALAERHDGVSEGVASSESRRGLRERVGARELHRAATSTATAGAAPACDRLGVGGLERLASDERGDGGGGGGGARAPEAVETRDAGRAARGGAAPTRTGVCAAGDRRDRAGLLGYCVQAALADGNSARTRRGRTA